MSKYKDIEIKLFGETYKYRVDEPEELIEPIKNEIIEEIEKYVQKFGEENTKYVLLLLLLNEKLETNKISSVITELIKKYEDSFNLKAP